MALVVQKFGGTSVADAERIRQVARRVADTRRAGNDVVVVVSAMGRTTDDLIALAAEISPDPPRRELDMLLTTGERVSMALLAMALHEEAVEAVSFTGSQAGILTDDSHGAAKIVEVTGGRVREALLAGRVVIVAGFQGVSPITKEITTLGRGGSDASAVALAAALGADMCEIYTDVDGVFTADPRIVPDARMLHEVSFEEMLELAAHGSRVLMARSVEFGRRFGIPIHVRSSFHDRPGTWVKEAPMEQAIISGVAHDTSEAKITVVGVPDTPGVAATLFERLAEAGINVDMIVQNVAANGNATDMTFTVQAAELTRALAVIDAAKKDIGHFEVKASAGIAKISVIGVGMRSHAGVAARMFQALAEKGINILAISTSEIKISVLIDAAYAELAVRTLHTLYGLDAD